jgi:hypothetical protein
MKWLLGLAAALLPTGTAGAQPPAERTAAIGENIDWSQADQGAPGRYRIGPILLTLTTAKAEDLGQTHLRVVMPGYAPIEAHGVTTWMETVRVAVGRWGDGRLFVMFQSYTGGAHCCASIQLILPEDGQLRVIPVGTWDGDFRNLPPDIDGDGAPDFIVPDNRFLYAFASYAASRAPPQIWNIVGRRAVDVSAAPRYRPLFLRAMNQERGDCLAGGPQSNSPCAAYVAAAARVGQFDRAWREMLGAYERTPAFPPPAGCRIAAPFGNCPQGQEVAFPDYPRALRHFLTTTGYLPSKRD